MIEKFNNWVRLNENKNNFNNLIDYTFLKDKGTVDDIKALCEEAVENNFYAVCVLPDSVGTAKAFLEDEDVLVCTVISFPKGDDTTNNKVKEAMDAISDGADEIDMVMNYQKLKELAVVEGDEYDDLYDEILEDVKKIARVCHSDGIILKVIIEVEELNYNQIKIACDICVEAGADFVKSSTGFAKNMKSFEEKIEKIKYMRKILPEYMKIKISGGVRNIDQINQVLPFVDRIGTSIVIE